MRQRPPPVMSWSFSREFYLLANVTHGAPAADPPRSLLSAGVFPRRVALT